MADIEQQSVQQTSEKKVKKVKKVTIKKNQTDLDGTTTTTVKEFSDVTKETEEPQG